MTMPTDHWTPKVLAAYLGVSERTLNRWHALRVGPPRITVGRTILYRSDAFEKWLVEHETSPVHNFLGAWR